MKNRIIKLVAAIVAVFSLSVATLAPVYAADDICTSNVPDSVKAAAGCKSEVTESTAAEIAIKVINIVIGFSGIIAVAFIIVGGFQYMTSTGDAGKVKKAKDTILYAVIGLVIVAFSFAIVNFAIANLIKKPQETKADTTSYSLENALAIYQEK